MAARWKLCSFFLLSSFLHGQSFSKLSADANAARDANQLDQAAALYRQALAIQPSWAEGWFSLGTIEYDRNLYKDAASAFAKVVHLAPKQGTSHVMLGLCEFELGLEASALRYLQEGRRLGIPDNPQLRNVALFHEGVLLQRSAKFDAAQAALDSLCSAGVETSELIQTLGMIALRLRDKTTPAAIAVSQIGHAEWLAGQNKFDDAHREYSAALESFPDFPNIHLAYGRFLLKEHDTAAAIPELEREIKNQPTSVVARLQIAAVKYRVDSAAGLPYAEEAVKLDPTMPLGRYLLGLLLLDTGDYHRALPELETAQKFFIPRARRLLRSGLCLCQSRAQAGCRERPHHLPTFAERRVHHPDSFPISLLTLQYEFNDSASLACSRRSWRRDDTRR